MGGAVRSPDFTIRYNGKTYYWEHLGMLQLPEYKRNWKRKKQWYIQNGIELYSDENPNGTLITSEDDKKGGISSKEVDELIKKIFKRKTDKKEKSKNALQN